VETTCGEDHNYLFIEGQTYLIGADGKLMSSRRGPAATGFAAFRGPEVVRPISAHSQLEGTTDAAAVSSSQGVW
jgi:hypothetical protein